MIPLEKQVTSLELSKRLKELGEKQDGLYSYFQYDKWNVILRRTNEIFAPNNECGYNKGNLICSAFTVAELGERIKEWCKDANFCPLPLFDKQTKKWNNFYADDNYIAETEADSRAKILIYLIENKLMEINE